MTESGRIRGAKKTLGTVEHIPIIKIERFLDESKDRES